MGDASVPCILVGAPATLGDLGDGPTLVVEADEQRCRRVSLDLARRGLQERVQLRHGVLSAVADVPVTWHRYSDSRLDGPLPLAHWQQRYPNLQLLAEEQRHGETLTGVLESWPAVQEGVTALHLIVRQGDPLALLAGAGPWFDRIALVQLRGSGAQEQWQEALDQQLGDRGFARCRDRSLCWTRDLGVVQLQQSQASLETVRAEVEQERRQQAELQSTLDCYRAALCHLFPSELYRQKRPDLEGLSEEALVEHFARHGLQEGTDLSLTELQEAMLTLKQERDRLEAQVQELGARATQSAEHLAVLKDLFARIVALREH